MLSLIGIILLLAGLANGEENSAVTMKLYEFQELFESARLADGERRIAETKKKLEADYRKKIVDLETSSRRLETEVTEQRDGIFPENYQILSHTAAGTFNRTSSSAGVEKDVASFDIDMKFRIFSSRWTMVPISNTTSLVASNWKLSWQEKDGEDFESIDYVANPEAMLLLRSDQHVLATNKSGLFHLTFTSHSRVSKTRNLNGLSLSSLLYPLSEVSLRLTSVGFVREVSVQPAAAVLQVQPEEGYTDIKATLPLTSDKIEVRWLDIVDSHDEEKATEAKVYDGTPTPEAGEQKAVATESPHITVVHDVLHSVAEGIVRSTHVLVFNTASEMSAPNSVQFVIHGERTRVTSVVGHALSSWEATEHNSDASPSSLLVRAYFKSSHLDSTVTLHVHTELDQNGKAGGETTHELELPRVTCKDVLRQTGHIGIIKVANVEVHEHKTSGLARCEPSEIASQLRLNTDRPIVLSYKYLNPNNTLVLRVKEHESMDTLDATVDRVHYKALVTDTHTVHSLLIIMQSTKLQYLELQDLALGASMFTVLVNSVPTKPVKGPNEENSILVPLLVGLNPETANEGISLRTSVEVSYFSHHPPLGSNGTLQLNPPHIRLPISVLTVDLRLPTEYEYEFTGDFGRDGLDKLGYPIPNAFSYKTGTRVVPNDYKFSQRDDFVALEDTDVSDTGAGAVKVKIPRTGRSFYFQRLLVVNTELSLNASYALPPPPKKSLWPF